jgi:DnaJ homolog subfamily C member 7
MPSFFRKNSEQKTPKSPRASSSVHKTTTSSGAPSSPSGSGKSKGYFVREREGSHTSPHSNLKDKDKRPSLSGSKKSSRYSRRPSEDTHPLNLPPEEIRRLSYLERMSSGSTRESGDMPNGGEDVSMSGTTPAPEERPPGAFPEAETNGENVNGEAEGGEGPVPPPHRTPTEEKQELPPVDPEACKAAGNKFYKDKLYGRAIDEYTKGPFIRTYRL